MPNGFTILEVLVAVFLIIVGILGIFTLIWQISRWTSVSFNELTAAYLLQEGFELVQHIRDSNWLAERTWDYGLTDTDCDSGCGIDYRTPVLDPGFANSFLRFDGFFNYQSGSNTQFKRKIFISENQEEAYLLIDAEVSWPEKGTEQKIKAREMLYNWY